MSKMTALLAGSVLAASALTGVATAEVTGNFGVSSNYIFRGDATNRTAVSGGLDWTGTSGLYAGAWGTSGTDFAAANGQSELDVYAGYGIGAGSLTIDLGAIAYLYPGDIETSSANATHGNSSEVYVGVAGAAWNVYVWYNFGIDSTEDDESAYIEGNASINAWDFHLGVKTYIGDAVDTLDEEIDFSVAYNIGDFSFGASTKYIDNDVEDTERPEFFASWGKEFSVK